MRSTTRWSIFGRPDRVLLGQQPQQVRSTHLQQRQQAPAQPRVIRIIIMSSPLCSLSSQRSSFLPSSVPSTSIDESQPPCASAMPAPSTRLLACTSLAVESGGGEGGGLGVGGLGEGKISGG